MESISSCRSLGSGAESTAETVPEPAPGVTPEPAAKPLVEPLLATAPLPSQPSLHHASRQRRAPDRSIQCSGMRLPGRGGRPEERASAGYAWAGTPSNHGNPGGYWLAASSADPA